MYAYAYVHTLTKHFILIRSWASLCFAALILHGKDSSRCRKHSLWDSNPFWHDCIMQLLHQMDSTGFRYDDWEGHWRLNSLSCLVWDNFFFVTWCIILLDIAVGSWANYGHEGRVLGFILFVPNSDPCIFVSQQNSRLFQPG